MNALTDRPDVALLDAALANLHASTGIGGALATTDGHPGIVLRLPGQTVFYHAHVKPRIDRIAILRAFHAAAVQPQQLLITTQLSAELAGWCRQHDLQFIDAAGNAYLNNHAGLYVFVSGRKGARAAGEEPAGIGSQAALRICFVLLADERLLNASYRDIAAAAKVSLGVVGPVLANLAARHFLGIDGTGKRAFMQKAMLVGEWSAGYLNRLSPKLRRQRFVVAEPDALLEWQPEPGVSAWGGEVAAALLTGNLHAQSYTIYMDHRDKRALAALLSAYRLRPDAGGQLELVDMFWDPARLPAAPTVPIELVYADLLRTLDPRLIETAALLYQQVLDHAQHPG